MRRIFVFPGQGSQSIGMGQTIYDRYDIAKNIFGKVNDILKKNLTEIMFRGPIEDLNLTTNAQPALMSVSVAILSVILEAKKTKIQDLCCYVAGHSLGEYTALWASGCISLEDATKLLESRGLFMQNACEVAHGSMAACINIALEELQILLNKLSTNGTCVIANDNSKNQIVISGQTHLIDDAIQQIQSLGGRAIKLKVNGAFHSPLMQEAQDLMSEKIEKSSFKNPVIPIIMNVTGAVSKDPLIIKETLKKQITSGVKWRQTIEFAKQHELEIVEIGSGSALSNLAKRSGYPYPVRNISNADDLENFLND